MKILPLRWYDHLWLFGIPTLLNLIACRIAIPFLDAHTSLPIEVSYFLSVGLLVLVPMFAGALVLSSRDAGSSSLSDILERMRFRKLNLTDCLWTVGGFVLLSAASFVIAKIFVPALGMDATPFFFQNMPLDGRHRWIIAVWPLFFFFNIFGEEFLWRGYILPRQELLAGKWAWLLHGILWSIWHLPMGIDLVVSAVPTFFILPAIVQFRKNTAISTIIHTVFGGFGFLVLAFGGL